MTKDGQTVDPFAGKTILTALRQVDIHCPRDVSIASLEDTGYVATTTPGITAVALPIYASAGRALKLLLHTMSNDDPPPMGEPLHSVLHQRESVGPARRRQEQR